MLKDKIKTKSDIVINHSAKYDELLGKAEKYLDEMLVLIRPTAIRPLLWLFSKIWQKIYD